MKKINLKILLLGVSIVLAQLVVAQSSSSTNIFAPGKFLGFTNNGASPLDFRTNNTNRMVINGNLTTLIQGVNQNVTGYVGISPLGYFANNSPRAMLHLDGPTNVPQFGGDWRSWMQTGMYLRENSDAMYVGLKNEFASGGVNRSDAVINWSDDPTTNGGVDKLRFLFTSTANSGNGDNTNPLLGSSYNGYEMMRMQSYPAITNGAGFPVGHIGIGPLFTNALPPQNRLHMNSEDWVDNYLQISSQNGTGQTGNDGVKLGVLNSNNNVATSGNALLYNQENRHLLFSTNNITPSGIFAPYLTNERMRITNYSAPTNNGIGFSYGIWNPGNLTGPALDHTRISISQDPTQPLSRPMCLLHLGYNISPNNTANNYQGWRPWMDVGTMTSQETDNIYVGLKNEGTNRKDAVLQWGDDYSAAGGLGPDRMRVIFTSPATGQAGAGPGAMSTANGLEFVRYVPFHNVTANANDPRMGLGDFNTLGIDPQNTFHVNTPYPVNAPNGAPVAPTFGAPTGFSGVRLQDMNSSDVPQLNPGAGVLSVNAAGDLIYVPDGKGNNGPGNICAATMQNPLTSNWEIPLNNFNYRFADPAGTLTYGQNFVGIGTSCSPTAKLEVLSNVTTNTQPNVIAAKVTQNDIANSTNYSGIGVGVLANSFGLNKQNYSYAANAMNAGVNMGYYARLNGVFNGNANQTNFGVLTDVSGGVSNVGVNGRATSSSGGTAQGGVFNGTGPGVNYGVQALASGGTTAYGVYGSAASASGNNYAGYFNGDVVRTGTDNFTSDQNLKQHIDTITNAMGIINQLKPRTFDYRLSSYPSMNLPSGKQYGLIAQDVQAILPELVNTNTHPAVLDTAGNVVTPSVSYLTLEYQQLTGIMIRAMQQQQSTINKQDSLINAMQQQLSALASNLNQCCSNNSAARAAGNSPASVTETKRDVELSDKDVVVLNQNVPNPFAESTYITYNIPAQFKYAQIIFSTTDGKIIKAVDIKETGRGRINVFANDLTSGLYTYSLIIDGQVIDTKKMVKQD